MSSLRSMTGYGWAKVTSPMGEMAFEMISINSRALEIHFHLPRGFSGSEVLLRRQIAQSLTRGRISVRLFADPLHEVPSLAVLRQLKRHWDQVAKALKLKGVTLEFLAQEAHRLEGVRELVVGDSKMEKALLKGLKQALAALDKMKAQEGEELVRAMQDILKAMEKLLKVISLSIPTLIALYRKKLGDKLKALDMESSDVLAREVALFADRSDISEELTRFASHMKQLHQVLKEKKGGVGRQLDFIVQEMMREANTMAAKALDTEAKHKILELKGLVEQLREQAQNIE